MNELEVKEEVVEQREDNRPTCPVCGNDVYVVGHCATCPSCGFSLCSL